MIAKVKSCGLLGLDGYRIEVEADVSMGFPCFDIVGLPDAAVKESKQRVTAALKNCGFEVPARRITINLAPADRKKEGATYDLPIAVGILLATGQLAAKVDNMAFFGELSLDGKVRPVSGMLPLVVAAAAGGMETAFLSADNAREAAVVSGIDVFGVSHLQELVQHLRGEQSLTPTKLDVERLFGTATGYPVDFADVKGQQTAKRAVEVAVAGGHNILMIGSPGSGKSMLAQRIPTILPELSFEEALETTKIHSVAGTLPSDVALLTTRPFRSPHHTISPVGLAGGGTIPKPGELSLAHNGVLFLDELPEFQRTALEVMRQPLEDGVVNISRIHASLTYPSNTLFVAAMNPCRCGYYGDPRHECTCTPPQISHYMSKISGPLLDRIDIHIDVPAVAYDDLQSKTAGETSAQIRERIRAARAIQLERYRGQGIFTNSRMLPKHIHTHCSLTEDAQAMLKRAFDTLGLSARAHDRILKVARTIADLATCEQIEVMHIAEAIQYRNLDRKLWEA